MDVPIAILIAVSYLIGSVPFGLMVGRAKGIDPRAAGSGNIGATNLGRLLGRKFFYLVFALDMLKGMLPVIVAGLLLHGRPDSPRKFVLWLLVAFAAIAGHMFSVFLGFKGGKGVATSCGVLLGLWPYYTLPGVIALAVFIVTFKTTRYVSLGSILAAVSFPVAYITIGLLVRPPWPVLGEQLPLLVFGVLIAAMIVFKHRSNIARLRAGTESKFARRPPADTAGA
jgi:glycerol-3-phosphate acyltransferase PlsY